MKYVERNHTPSAWVPPINSPTFCLVWLSSGPDPRSTCPDAPPPWIAWNAGIMCKVWKINSYSSRICPWSLFLESQALSWPCISIFLLYPCSYPQSMTLLLVLKYSFQGHRVQSWCLSQIVTNAWKGHSTDPVGPFSWCDHPSSSTTPCKTHPRLCNHLANMTSLGEVDISFFQKVWKAVLLCSKLANSFVEIVPRYILNLTAYKSYELLIISPINSNHPKKLIGWSGWWV